MSESFDGTPGSQGGLQSRPETGGVPPKVGAGTTHPAGGDVPDPSGEVDGDRGQDVSGGMIGEG